MTITQPFKVSTKALITEHNADSNYILTVFSSQKTHQDLYITNNWTSVQQRPTNTMNQCVILEKLIVTNLVKTLSVEPKRSLLCSCNPPLDPIQGLLNPIHSLIFYFLKIHLNNILPSISRSASFSSFHIYWLKLYLHCSYLPFMLHDQSTSFPLICSP